MKPTQIPEIQIKGDPFERGLQHGQQRKEAILDFFDVDFLDYYLRGGVDRDRMFQHAESCIPFLNQHVPDLLQELEGLSQATGLSVMDLVALHCHEEFFNLRGQKRGRCIAFAVSKTETGTGRAYSGQTLDWMVDKLAKAYLTHWEDSSGFRSLFLSFPGLLSCSGMNQAGLGLNWTSAGLWDSKNQIRPGVPGWAVSYGLLQRDSIESAVEWIRELPIAGWISFVLCDANGEVALLQGAPGKIAWTRSRAFLTSQGYFHDPDLMAHTAQAVAGRLPRPNHRDGRLLQLLSCNLGRLDHACVQNIFRDRQEQCAITYETKDRSNPDSIGTILAYYSSPLEGRFFIARGPVPEHAFQEVCI